jgi:hypothetical protein
VAAYSKGGTMDLRTRTWRRVGGTAAAALMALALSAPAAAGPNSGKLSLTAGADITTAYFFRGILQERNGFIMQPYAELNLNLHSDETGPITSFTLIGGSWNSIQSEQTLARGGSGPSNWYESDAYGGFKFSLLKKFETKLLYIAYTYPNGAFPTVQELDAVFSLNDSDWLGKFALYPALTVAGEIDNTALGVDKGWYFEPAIRPSFTIIQSDTYPLTLAVPVNVGLGSNYFDLSPGDDDFFGYLRGGLIFGLPLAFIPADYGTWSVTAGAYIYTFGNNLETLNQGNDPWVVGTWGFSMTY